ncbi:glypican-2 [Gadus chalcogrammus]|uniref:glypican-2 n=1 Tax=Gadus chalcogrammus TaxID=1042646 RepID=UPI0024C48C04|nr:glypican-2 [Gadus chalcogrammus]
MDFRLSFLNVPLFVLSTLAALSWTSRPVSAGKSCSDTRQVYAEKGYSTNTAPLTQISGEHLRLCPQDYTCCSSQMEETLSLQSERDYLKAIEDTSQFLSTTFTQRHRKFDEFFKEIIDLSEKSMNQMFTTTYGRLFTQNVRVFQELFSELRKYYSGGSVSLSEVLSDFWSSLVELVFSLVNPQYQFNDDYLECVTKHAEQLQPFGDMPRKLRVQVSRAFIAARALSQGLATGRDIVNKATKLSAGSECARALMRQWYCPLCRGVPTLRPCHSLCLNVMKGCLANQADLDTEWNNFVDALYQVSEKLEGPFNMELAAESISVKVSEAIMHMQENSVSISAKIPMTRGLSPRLWTNSLCQHQLSWENLWLSSALLPPRGRTTVTSAKGNPSCVYTLPKNNVDSSDAGTYYCALAACGEVVFGNGTQLDIPGTLGASYSVPHDSVIQEPQDGKTDSLNYAALEFSGRKTRGRKKNSERTQKSLLAANKLRPVQAGQDTDFMDSEGGSGSVGGDRGGRYNDDWPGYWPNSRLTTNPRNSSSNPANISRVRGGSMWIGMRTVAHVLHTPSIVFDGLCLPLVEITGYLITLVKGLMGCRLPVGHTANA